MMPRKCLVTWGGLSPAHKVPLYALPSTIQSRLQMTQGQVAFVFQGLGPEAGTEAPMSQPDVHWGHKRWFWWCNPLAYPRPQTQREKGKVPGACERTPRSQAHVACRAGHRPSHTAGHV